MEYMCRKPVTWNANTSKLNEITKVWFNNNRTVTHRSISSQKGRAVTKRKAFADFGLALLNTCELWRKMTRGEKGEGSVWGHRARQCV